MEFFCEKEEIKVERSKCDECVAYNECQGDGYLKKIDRDLFCEMYERETGSKIDDSTPLAKLIKNDSSSFFSDLSTLCGCDLIRMVDVFVMLSRIPALKEEDRIDKKNRRKETNAKSKEKWRTAQEFYPEFRPGTPPFLEAEKLTKFLSNRMPSNVARKVAHEYVNKNYPFEPFDRAPWLHRFLAPLKGEDNNQGVPSKTNWPLTYSIHYMYVYAKASNPDKTENWLHVTIANLLTTANIRKANNSEYTRRDIYHIVNKLT